MIAGNGEYKNEESRAENYKWVMRNRTVMRSNTCYLRLIPDTSVPSDGFLLYLYKFKNIVQLALVHDPVMNPSAPLSAGITIFP